MTVKIDLDRFQRAEVILGGESLWISFPTLKQLQALSSMADASKGEDVSDDDMAVMKSLMIDLGFPEKLLEKLNVVQWAELMHGITDAASKKK